METKAPCDYSKLLAGGNQTVTSGATGEDLATFVDGSQWEYLLYCATITANVSATQLEVRAAHAEVSAGTTGLAEVKDVDGTTSLVATLGAATTPVFAVGTSIALFVRTHGAKRYHSPKFVATGGTSCDVAYTVWGINARDTKENRTAWNEINAAAASGTMRAAAVGVAQTALS
jgi:hypothetical protein